MKYQIKLRDSYMPGKDEVTTYLPATLIRFSRLKKQTVVEKNLTEEEVELLESSNAVEVSPVRKPKAKPTGEK